MLQRRLLLKSACLILAGCAGAPERPAPVEATPDSWQRDDVDGDVRDGWLIGLQDEALVSLAADAINNSHALGQSAAILQQAQQSLYSTRADLFPTLSAGLNASRRRNVINIISGQQLNQAPIFENFALGASLRWQPDIWGQFSNATKAAAYSYAASEAAYLDARRQLVGDVARNWYTLLEARALLAVAHDRLDNAARSLEIVESGYRQGLNEALDLYTARSAYAQQQGNLALAIQREQESAAALQLLSAAYPSGDVTAQGELEWRDIPLAAGVPAEIIARRGDLQLAWLQLMSADASVAVAHRQRFPALTISANIDDESGLFDDVFNLDPLSWSILGGLTQPLFAGGRLRANQRVAEARAAELEQSYLQQVNVAFSEVENTLSNDASLKKQYDAAVTQRDNANEGLTLALEQYQRGLITYTAVLQTQQRAFDARGAVVQINAQRLRNRINLYVALGSDDMPTPDGNAAP